MDIVRDSIRASHRYWLSIINNTTPASLFSATWRQCGRAGRHLSVGASEVGKQGRTRRERL